MYLNFTPPAPRLMCVCLFVRAAPLNSHLNMMPITQLDNTQYIHLFYYHVKFLPTTLYMKPML